MGDSFKDNNLLLPMLASFSVTVPGNTNDGYKKRVFHIRWRTVSSFILSYIHPLPLHLISSFPCSWLSIPHERYPAATQAKWESPKMIGVIYLFFFAGRNKTIAAVNDKGILREREREVVKKVC